MQIPAVQLGATGAASDPKAAAKVGRAASDFEALLIAQMLRSARESSASDSNGSDGGEDNSSLMELSEQQFAQALSNSGGLGLGKMVVSGLTKYANR